VTTDSLSSASRRSMPVGVVTFLFTDIQGSTRLLRKLGDRYGEVLSTHNRLMRDAFRCHDGWEVDTQGDAFFICFASPQQAVAAAADAQRALCACPWPEDQPVLVRMGLHAGEPVVVGDHYVGIDVHRAARICSAAHGGQVLLSARVLDLVGDRLPAGVAVRDLGKHWLKDLPEPEHVLQLVIEGMPTTFPAVRSLRPPTNVPQHAAALIGRGREKRDLAALVTTGSRLVTVIGPGGVGKTRLAGAVALDLVEQFPHGVYFVDLSDVGEAELVVASIARVLGVPLEGDESAVGDVADQIGEKQMLLVLDNFEHVLGAAVAVAGLLQQCPRLHVLVTSRVLLELRDEHAYALPPMGLPQGTSLVEVRDSEAVQLFVARARLVGENFRLTDENAAAVADVCRLLDGLPLAIQLAAARTRLFSPRALAGRLADSLRLLTSGTQDVPSRHRTLRATLDWSYALLSEAERRFFRDFAIFSGGARLESVEAVMAPEQDALALVTALVNHSLLVEREDTDGQPRIRMLQTLRDYAMELLREHPADHEGIAERHAQHYLALVTELMPTRSLSSRDKMQRVQDDYDNVRAALSHWLDERGDDPGAAVSALRLATAMGQYWYGHGQSTEGSAWLERALAKAPGGPPATRALALLTLGMMCEQREQLDRAMELLTRGRELARQAGDHIGEARCLNGAGIVADSAGNPEEAQRYLEAAVTIFDQQGDTLGKTDALNTLGLVHLHEGRWEKARDVFRQNLLQDRAMSNDWGAACSALNLALAYLVGRAAADARPLIRDAMQGFREWQDPNGVTETLESAVGLAVSEGQWTAAARLVGAVDAARETLGLRGSPPDRARLDAWADLARAHLGPAVFEESRHEGAAMTYEQAATYALDEVVGR
jgi:predicted ATPase/class 3 adenylate cyclase